MAQAQEQPLSVTVSSTDNVSTYKSFGPLSLTVGVFEDAAQTQGFGTAPRAFEAADTSQIVGGLLRLYAELTQFVATLAVRAFVDVEPYEERRDTIEQRENRPERTQHPAPWSSDEENRD